jgi:transposase
MFYYIKMENMIPEDHILRLIDKHVDFSFIYEKVRRLYSSTGRPSVDPVVMIKMLLVGYLYGITSERRLCEEVEMHIGYRWFVGLTLEDSVPDHSTFSKNRHGRFRESKIFDEVIRLCFSHGLLTGDHLTIDNTLVEANASLNRMEPVVVPMTTREYLQKVEEENPGEDEPDDVSSSYKGQRGNNSTHRSSTDPDARLCRSTTRKKSHLAYSDSYLMDSKSRIILGVKTTQPDRKSNTKAGQEMLREAKWKYRIKPKVLGGDKEYATGEFIRATLEEGVAPHVPVIDTRSQNDKGIYPLSKFSFAVGDNTFICPQGKPLKYQGVHKRSRQHVWRARRKDCKACPAKTACTRDQSRSLSVHIDEAYLKQARAYAETREYRISQRMRKRIEELFGEAKSLMGLRRAKFRGIRYVKEQFLLTATVQNLKRMVKLLSRKGPDWAASLRGKALAAGNWTENCLTGATLFRLPFFSGGQKELCPFRLLAT